ncbi:uncharacterized protein G2W53_015555 [Senna tora]|uniref:Uncharacterized protein n=1 Tax=Senna tora TaxID=362788 RepID=A0A835CA61_9FABA|nr:uncharacterized protein G2W53_015555 [Senna tora]
MRPHLLQRVVEGVNLAVLIRDRAGLKVEVKLRGLAEQMSPP